MELKDLHVGDHSFDISSALTFASGEPVQQWNYVETQTDVH